MKKHVLFLQGAGEGTHISSINMAGSLKAALGHNYDVLFPQMPRANNPVYREWADVLAGAMRLFEGDVYLAGHSLGGSVILKYLSENRVERLVSGVFVLAAPYWGVPDWEIADYTLRDDFPVHLPDVPLYFYHARDDDVVPVEHLALYGEKLPQAIMRVVTEGGHDFAQGLSPVAEDIARL